MEEYKCALDSAIMEMLACQAVLDHSSIREHVTSIAVHTGQVGVNGVLAM